LARVTAVHSTILPARSRARAPAGGRKRTPRGARVVAATLALALVGPLPPLTLRAARADAGDDGGRASFVRDQRNLMLGLGAWSAASLVAGAVLLAASDRDVPRYFGIQSLAWGAVDGAIAAIALAKLAGDDGAAHPASYWEGERRSLRTVFWVNAALDVAYVAVGALLWALGKTDALRGTGAGVVAQGAFLLAFDTTGALVVSPR
jgi:hypothetical protein